MTTPILDTLGRAQRLAAAFGLDAPSGRELHAMRAILAAGAHDDPDAAALLDQFRAEDEEAEELRLGLSREARSRTVETWTDFKEARANLSDVAPEGTRIIHLRDEISRELHRLAVPLEWFQA